MVAALARQQHVAQDDTRSVYLCSSEYVPHEVLIQVVKDLVVLQSRHDIIDDYLMEQLVLEVELAERHRLVAVGSLHPLADAEIREWPRFLLKVAETFAGGEIQYRRD